MNTPDDVSGILKMANDWLLAQLAQLVEPRFGCTEIVPKNQTWSSFIKPN